ncbi:MAG: protein-L-isoaspartate(D-aspartate) O-methyltransferase [Methylococcaceae bacterium]|nr:protein-L-isoaspartate(D-aspartate) O-methyltransferase [Methylococcaceae bacterium]
MSSIETMLQDIEMEVKLTERYLGKDRLDERVMAAMKQVPRQQFVPESVQSWAFHNGPLPIGLGQTISQPYIVALMSDLLNTDANDTILEIGTGSGYQTAVLSCLVNQVYSIEIIADLANKSRARLKSLGFDNVTVHHGDGYYGWSEYAPYDGIIVTAAAPHIPKHLVEQLKTGGRLVIPVDCPDGYQELIVLKKRANNKVDIQKILDVSFVPLTGEHTTTR